MSYSWDLYTARMKEHGNTKRGARLKKEIRDIEQKLPENLSYTTVTIYDQAHGYNIATDEMKAGAFTQNVAIINSDNLNEKRLITMPGEDVQQGDLVEWMGTYWLVVERDFNTTIYTKAKLLQCNYLLRWVCLTDHKVYEQWCAVEDGTKYLTGELEDRQFISTRGDSRIAITIARNDITKLLVRENRFLVDDYESPQMLAYILSKPLKTGLAYSDHGVYKFVLQEVTNTINDNFENRVADYYKYFPRENAEDESEGENEGEDNGNDSPTADPSDQSDTTETGDESDQAGINERSKWL